MFPEQATISWMITKEFRDGQEMSVSTNPPTHQMRYQPRGWVKYADIVRLFGWAAFTGFYSMEVRGRGQDSRLIRLARDSVLLAP